MDFFNKILLELPEIPTSLYQELKDFYKHSIENENCSCNIKLANETKSFLITSIAKEPYLCCQVIQELHKTKHGSTEDIFATALEVYILLLSNENDIDSNTIYMLLSSQTKLSEEILSDLHELMACEKLNSSFVYLSLLSQDNLDLLRQVVEHEKTYFNTLDIRDQASLFNYCLISKQHWLFYFLQNDITFDLEKFSIVHKLWFLKLIYFTNLQNFETGDIKMCLSSITKSNISDGFLKYYFTEIKRVLEVCETCIDIEKKNDFILMLTSKSCLETLNNFIDLNNIELYSNIKSILMINNQYLTEVNNLHPIKINERNYNELDIYNAYYILLIVNKYLVISETENTVPEYLQKLLNNSKNILQSSPIDFQIGAYENMFALIFMRLRENKNTQILRKPVQYVATIIKSCLKEIKSKNFSGANKKCEEYIKLTNLIKYVTDFLWRLDLLKSQGFLKEEIRDVDIMSSSPSTLVQICLENDDFGKAHEIIEVFNIRDSNIEHEIDFMEKFQYLQYKKDTNDDEQNIASMIKFCTENSCSDNDKDYDKHEELKFFKGNEIYMNLVDAAITYSNNFESSLILSKAASEHRNLTNIPNDYDRFCNNLFKVFENASLKNKVSLQEILRNSRYSLDFIKYKEIENLYLAIKEKLNNFNDKSNRKEIYLSLSEVINSQNNENYLKKLYNYLSLLSQLLSYEGDIFEILTQNRAALISELFFTQKIPPRELESLFQKLELDIVYHISWNCLPNINLQTNIETKQIIQYKDFKIFLNELKNLYKMEKESLIHAPEFSLLSYIRRRNWLLAYLINKTHTIEEAKPDTNSDRTKYFKNLLGLQRNKTLKHIYDDNIIIASLYKDIDVTLLINYIEKCKSNWKEIYNVINSLSENLFKSNPNLGQLKNYVIYNLVSEINDNSENFMCVLQISDTKLRVQCILENLKNWPEEYCTEVLKTQLTHNDVDLKSREELQIWFMKIELYEKINNKWNEVQNWYDVYTKSMENPKEVFNWLIKYSIEVSIVLQWIEIHKSSINNFLNLIDDKYFLTIILDNVEITKIKLLLDLLPFDHRINLCKELIIQVRKLQYLEFLFEYLTTLLPELESDYSNIKLSIKIIACFHPNEHDHMWCLINKPLLIIEQLIMNTRLEKLGQVLDLIKSNDVAIVKYDVSVVNIDKLLRIYAEKSLAFRGIQPYVQKKSMELKLLQSLDTVSDDTNESHRKLYSMPENVPDKSDWVPNEEASECMCCQTVTFSMFNRRHHCRRCGRVICGNCSTKKMEIIDYGNIAVRVCDDCYKQSDENKSSSIKSEYNSSKSSSYICWTLTDDEKHNDMAREEFSYEYAPSVSLCLSILKLHSESVEYPRFLLSQCKKLLPHLQATIKEIDYSFVIQMLKSLATAAKIISLNSHFKAELILCNNMLLQVELLGLLADRGCSDLLSFSQGEKKYKLLEHPEEYYINSAMLRRLNDKLMELEQWSVALEVSTKAGLDNGSVFAAWGMSCLKSGALQMAREKFQYCLEKNLYYDTSSEMNASMTVSTVSESRSVKTPPLVNEIISVLESKSYTVYKNVPKAIPVVDFSSSTLSLNTTCTATYEPAVCVLNKLQNLNNIINGSKNEEINCTKSRIYLEPIFYNECLYYLMKYGSHLSILKFYLRHEDLREALHYILENRLQADVFIDVYMMCVQDGNIDDLHNEMQTVDPHLYIWEVYLRSICGFLEKNKMFNILYNLQIFMCDYVRAAMTCIKFYKDDASNFTELLDREHFLHDAQNHLKQELEQEQWVQVSTIPGRKMSTASSDSSTHEKGFALRINPRNIDKHINTIWRQVEVTKFLAECEMESRQTMDVLDEIIFGEDTTPQQSKRTVPTLFDSNTDKIKLAVLSLLCGKNIEDGFGIAFRIVQDYHLKYLKIYCLSGKYLSQKLQETATLELISCIRSSGLSEETVNETCDEVLTMCVHTLTEVNAPGTQREKLIKLISDPSAKINAYIESKQLKCAYLLAVQHNRNSDIRKILREAERLNQPQIKAICIKRLSQMQ